MLRTTPILEAQEFRLREKIPTTICPTDVEAARQVARIFAETIRQKQTRGERAVLGLATGNTPVGVYRELIRMHQEEGLDFSNVTTFNLDEYYPMERDSIHSYHRWMQENFFHGVNIPADQIHIPDGTLEEDDVPAFCRRYEAAIEAAGGIDVQILGIGRTGHIGFNEPGSSRESLTRLIALDPVTRRDAAADFFGEANVPYRAITMGVGTILRARKIVLMALGEQKAPVIARAVEGPVTNAVAASFLQEHPNSDIVIDRASSAELTRVASPWELGEVEWDPEMRRQAAIWLSLKTGKSLLKLSLDDYDAHHLASLVREVGSADRLNHQTFTSLNKTIVYKTELPRGKTILCFSPHPDDDVISMGGTLKRLAELGNEVHAAYMTSGNIAVSDEHTLQMLDFWADVTGTFDFAKKEHRAFLARIHEFLATKSPGQIDSPEVQKIKTLIRCAEAVAACRSMNIPDEHAHFLDLPFYQTGLVQKRPIGAADVAIVRALLEKVKPYWVFVAGEMSDPHGTHRVCAEAIFRALAELDEGNRPETVWLYRGAWQEWEPDVVDMVIPLTHSELKAKIFGIFKHQSQKDKALFPGPYDDREFWQRAEARNTETAARFNSLGLPEHHAMEAFVLHPGW